MDKKRNSSKSSEEEFNIITDEPKKEYDLIQKEKQDKLIENEINILRNLRFGTNEEEEGILQLQKLREKENKFEYEEIENVEETEECKYLNDNDKKDCIYIYVPEKYRENDNTKIDVPGEYNCIVNFFNNLHLIREQNLTLRDITLNKIVILQYNINSDETENLYLNMGLNPYLYFNDYYISNLNCYFILEPILIFKRYKKFNPYNDTVLPIKHKVDIMNVREKDLIVTFTALSDNYNTRTYDEHYMLVEINDFINPKSKIWQVQVNCDNEENIIVSQTKKISNLKRFVNINKTLEKDPHKLFLYDKNIYLWKYGSIKYPPEEQEFKWFGKKKLICYEIITTFCRLYKYDFFDSYDIHGVSLTDLNRKKIAEKTISYIGYNEVMNRMFKKLKTIKTTSLCKDNKIIERECDKEGNCYIINSKFKNIIVNYILSIQEFMFDGNDKGIIKYIYKDNMSSILLDETLYENISNTNLYFILENGLEEYSKEVITNEDYDLESPDIYILLGFHTFPCFFSKELWTSMDFYNQKKWYFLIKSLNFLESTSWYYMYGLCCFFAQVIGPSYYMYEYYLISKNDYCPNNSNIINKNFAVAYYLVLYARMNSFWRSLTTTIWQYGNTTILTSDNYLRLSLIVNSICLYIVPLFTYTLFIELSNVTDLILNCLTGEFLINIDNLIIEFIGEEKYIKTLTKELLILAFLEKGYPKKNIMEGNTIELWLLTSIQIIQMFGTLLITFFVYYCI